MQVTVNQVKASITELESAGEEHIDDLKTLVIIFVSFVSTPFRTDINLTTCTSNVLTFVLQEEVAQENRQKMEVENQTVHEAKKELNKHRRAAEEVESKYSAVRERIDHLYEETEVLKVQ